MKRILKYFPKNWLPQNFDIMYRFHTINFLGNFRENLKKKIGKNNFRTANRIKFSTIFLEIKLQTL